jgi:mannose-6-phosphate isomerase-like protein (cupin superfamily)
MIKYLQLPFTCNIPLLQQEVLHITNDAWKLHYNRNHYEGNWSILALQSVNGDSNNLFSIQTTGNPHLSYKPTPYLEQSVYIQQLLQQLECEKTSIRLMRMEAGAVIKPHSDYAMSYEDGEVRFHIPVFTNENVLFFLQEERVVMEEGSCWYLNLGLTHRVRNEGSADRIHLVVDCLVNDWIREQFASTYITKKEMEKEEMETEYSSAEKEKIIKALRLQNTEISNRLAEELTNQNNSNHA